MFLLDVVLCVIVLGTATNNVVLAQESVTVKHYSVDGTGTAQIEVSPNPDYYYVLFLKDEFQVERPIDMAWLGEREGNGGAEDADETTITLSDQLRAYPQENYRVAQYPLSDPADLDGDGIDDAREWSELGRFNPFNSASEINTEDGVVAIPDRETFEKLSYKGSDVLLDDHLENLEYVKFFLLGMDTDSPRVYFMNTVTHRRHGSFAQSIGMECFNSQWSSCEGQMKGEIIYLPNVLAPDGTLGVYRFAFQPTDSYPFREIQRAFELLARDCHVFRNNLFYFPMEAALPRYSEEKDLYDASRVAVLLAEDIFAGVGYLPLNINEGYGRLTVMDLNDRPHPRDIVIYEALPNELSRVGGIITSVPQTPLSHVNLRAIQDGVPNAYIANALQQPVADDGKVLEDLLGKLVYYRVEQDSYNVRESTLAEVNAHYEAQRPKNVQVPERDLSMKEIKPLDDIGFNEWTRFGVKAANVATLRQFGFPNGTVPNGFAVPFHFYNKFMKSNGFYEEVQALLDDEEFMNDYNVQADGLKALQKRIEKAPMPQWMLDALETMHAAFPIGQPVRTRSSTNNEDLPGFSGAGLYDSYTHHPDEGHIEKSIKQVFASLWNFRAFSERQFLRIDHFHTAMGVLVHPNFEEEKANGVGVSTDPIYGSDGFYLNTQVGEDLVTNPDALSVPEEILVDAGFGSGEDSETGYVIVRPSNLVGDGEQVLSDVHLSSLVSYLGTIHERFRELYGVDDGSNEPFAMEIEYKVTREGQLAIKQARPWVFDAVHF